MTNPLPPLVPLHGSELLSEAKLAAIDRLDTDTILHSLLPGQPHCLKARPDGTMLDGHHRIHVLRLRQTDVDALPREIVTSDSGFA